MCWIQVPVIHEHWPHFLVDDEHYNSRKAEWRYVEERCIKDSVFKSGLNNNFTLIKNITENQAS